jgi:hypothetical protein
VPPTEGDLEETLRRDEPQENEVGCHHRSSTSSEQKPGPIASMSP